MTRGHQDARPKAEAGPSASDAVVVTGATGGSPAQIGSGARPAIRCGEGSVTSGMLAVDAERGSSERSPLLSANGSASAAAVVLLGELPFRASVVSRLARLRSG